MNQLAHLYLSRHSEKMMIGNFIADAVKGKKYMDYEEEISRGILMHRQIDSFTDHHQIISASKRFFRKRYGLFSSVLIDLVYDHFLAKNWDRYSKVPLHQFTAYCYTVFERYIHVMPERNKILFPFMQREDWLLNYARLEGIRRSLNGMSRRIPNNPGIEHAHEELQLNYASLEKDFTEYFPLLVKFIAEKFPD